MICHQLVAAAVIPKSTFRCAVRGCLLQRKVYVGKAKAGENNTLMIEDRLSEATLEGTYLFSHRSQKYSHSGVQREVAPADAEQQTHLRSHCRTLTHTYKHSYMASALFNAWLSLREYTVCAQSASRVLFATRSANIIAVPELGGGKRTCSKRTVTCSRRSNPPQKGSKGSFLLGLRAVGACKWRM